MKSSFIKHWVTLARHKTSASVEDAFWDDLRQIVKECDQTLSGREFGNLSSPSRLFVLGLLPHSRAH
jgi:predicted DNA-binding ribbon-helix-helix protein